MCGHLPALWFRWPLPLGCAESFLIRFERCCTQSVSSDCSQIPLNLWRHGGVSIFPPPLPKNSCPPKPGPHQRLPSRLLGSPLQPAWPPVSSSDLPEWTVRYVHLSLICPIWGLQFQPAQEATIMVTYLSCSHYQTWLRKRTLMPDPGLHLTSLSLRIT